MIEALPSGRMFPIYDYKEKASDITAKKGLTISVSSGPPDFL